MNERRIGNRIVTDSMMPEGVEHIYADDDLVVSERDRFHDAGRR